MSQTEIKRYIQERALQYSQTSTVKMLPPPPPPLPPPPPPLRRNCLHDLESLWWLALYFLTNWTISADPRYNTAEQLHLSEKLFNDTDERLMLLRRPQGFTDIVSVLPLELRDLARHLQMALHALVEAYWTLEEDIRTNRLRVPGRIYEVLHDTLTEMSRSLERTQDIVCSL